MKKKKSILALAVVMSALLTVNPLSFAYEKQTDNEESIDGNVQIDEINFPDAIFREYVETNFDKDQNGKLSGAEISNVKKIDIYGEKENVSGIKSLQGIKFFTELQELSCSKQKITAIDVTQNLKLKNLYCNENEISTLDVSQNILLEILDCRDTEVSDLDVSQNTKLKQLDCRNTNIESLDVSENPDLEVLECSDTGIGILNLDKNPKLREVYCANTGIQTLDVTNNTVLETLNCVGTNIKDLDVSANTKLVWLMCSNTGLKKLDISNNTELYTLSCENTQITELDISENPNLVWLYGNETPLAVLHVYENGDYMLLLDDPTNAVLNVNGDSFDLKDYFPEIDVSRISNIKGAKLEGSVLSGYKAGIPVSYTYDCGNSAAGNITINVRLDLNIQDSVISLDTEFGGVDFPGAFITPVDGQVIAASALSFVQENYADELASLGDDYKVVSRLMLNEVESSDVSKNVKDALAAASNDKNIGQYYDISVQADVVKDGKTVSGLENIAVTNLKEHISISLNIPEDLIKDGRTFAMLCYHDGQASMMETSETDNVITFQTGAFSTYALAYEDTQEAVGETGNVQDTPNNTAHNGENEVEISEAPRTGDTYGTFTMAVVVLGCAGIAVTVMGLRRKVSGGKR